MTDRTGTCPVCNGSKRVPASGEHRHIVYGYDRETDTFPCCNCGDQYQMGGGPKGVVALRPDGTPCTHAYQETGPERRRMYGWHEYTCQHCGDRHSIDSGD